MVAWYHLSFIKCVGQRLDSITQLEFDPQVTESTEVQVRTRVIHLMCSDVANMGIEKIVLFLFSCIKHQTRTIKVIESRAKKSK
jgi:hypothetical protein